MGVASASNSHGLRSWVKTINANIIVIVLLLLLLFFPFGTIKTADDAMSDEISFVSSPNMLFFIWIIIRLHHCRLIAHVIEFVWTDELSRAFRCPPRTSFPQTIYCRIRISNEQHNCIYEVGSRGVRKGNNDSKWIERRTQTGDVWFLIIKAKRRRKWLEIERDGERIDK